MNVPPFSCAKVSQIARNFGASNKKLDVVDEDKKPPEKKCARED